MQRTFSIHSNDNEMYLEDGRIRVCVIGGWSVKIHGFNVVLRNKETEEVIKGKQPFIRANVVFGLFKRAKRILYLDVKESGYYSIEFQYPKNLKVQREIWFFLKKTIPNEKLEIYFT